MVVVPTTRLCGPANSAPGHTVNRPLESGAWAHLDAPTMLPAWVTCEGFAGLIAYQAPPLGVAAIRESPLWRTHLVVRAVAFPAEAVPRYAVIIDVPVTAATGLQIQNDTGIELGDISTLGMTATDVKPVMGRAIEEDATAAATREALAWMTFLDYTDWLTGRSGNVVIAIGLNVTEIYERISATPLTQIGNYSVGQLLLILLAVVGGLFLAIQSVAFVMGLKLARSITGAVHELATGTEHVRRGDFTHRISVNSQDQLGDLADSFNSMTASVEDLLQEKAEKERLEQELRIARQIQMSLLPQGPFKLEGLSVTAHCEPAREVGGDYYDYLPLGDRRVGIIIADVAGKGTSAALYMAELKGLMLSLTQLHASPRELLIRANRIIAQHLDARSFITMTYAVVDMCTRTLTYARAGHCPLIYLPGNGAAEQVREGERGKGERGRGVTYQEQGSVGVQVRAARKAQIKAPDGLVLGLKIDNGQRFESLLEEVTQPLGAGDVVLLFTDGVTEAMNEAGEPFGEERLAALVEEHGDLPFEELRERILREIHAFVGGAGLHDDLTLVLLTIENVGGPEGPPLRRVEAGL